MQADRQIMEQLIFMHYQPTTRFTQDSPVYPDVWMEYYENSGKLDTYRADLILIPHKKSSAAELLKILADKFRVTDRRDTNLWEMAATIDSVICRLTFHELINVGLPLTNWWQNYLWHAGKATQHQAWLKQLVGAMLFARDKEKLPDPKEDKKALDVFVKCFEKEFTVKKTSGTGPVISLWSVSKNRAVSISIEKSIAATKADSVRRVFDVDGTEIAWAVLDTGIDARHPAFRRIDPKTGKPFAKAMGAVKDKFSNQTRIAATYDFTIFRDVLAMIQTGIKPGKEIQLVSASDNDEMMNPTEVNNAITEISRDLRGGRMINWAVIAPLLRIPHNTKEYKPPVHPHGTHVSGILGANQDKNESGYKLVGMCPGIDLYDIRVLDNEGKGEEFNILAALQFVRWLNNQKDGMVIHGANLSFSMLHEVASYACGLTPVCESCERLVAEGLVVVAAAGNQGQAIFTSAKGLPEPGFRMVNITDPGNAEAVITVGSTHRNRPHSYGVSYFSSKGPTGDGRLKPDLVAPGEKIVSTSIDDGSERMDGSSMAAPHVSGAAALLMAKHRELIGRPQRVKEILCKTATDLGREKYFQGCGMVDVLRAIQSV